MTNSSDIFRLIGSAATGGLGAAFKDAEKLEKGFQNISKEVGKLGGELTKTGTQLSKSLTAPMETGTEQLANKLIDKMNDMRGGVGGPVYNFHTTISAGNVIASEHSVKMFAREINKHLGRVDTILTT